MNLNNEQKNTYVRTQIVKTLLSMLKTQTLDSISISDLVKEAGVGRVSFYRNYESKKDILVQEERSLFKEWKVQYDAGTEEKKEDFSRSLLNFYKEHSEFYLSLYNAGMQEIIMTTIIDSMEISESDPNPVAYLKSSIGYMIYGWINEWMKRGMPETGDELASMINNSKNQ